MGWSLNGPKSTVRWSKRKIFGRDDFPEEGQLSRKHFEVVERKGRVFVQDLSSRNGTFIYGQQVKVSEAIEIQPGDSIKVGDSSFTLRAVEDFAPIWVDGGLFAVLALISLASPMNAWGLALGALGSVVVLSFLFVAFVVVAMASNSVIIRVLRKFWNPKTYAIHVSAVFTLTLALNQILLGIAGSEIARDLNQSRIEYFCLSKFQGSKCAKLLAAFPESANQVDKWKRDVFMEKLKAYQAALPKPERQPAAQAK